MKRQGTHSVQCVSIVAVLSVQLLSRAQMQTCLKERRPKCPLAWVQSALAPTPSCRIGCCIPRHMSLEQAGDCIKSFISLSVAFQKSTWIPREHGAPQLTAKPCATLHRASQEHRCQWSAPPATWPSAPLARRRGTHSTCARKTKLLQYQPSRGKTGIHGGHAVFQFFSSPGLASGSWNDFLLGPQLQLWDCPSLLVFPKYNSSLNITLNDKFYFLILIIVCVFVKLGLQLTLLKGEALQDFKSA